MPVRNAGTSTMVKCSPIAIRSGNPHNEDPWEWHCGFYPDSHPGEHRGEAAATFDEARADFEPRLTFRRGGTRKRPMKQEADAL